MCWSWAHCWFRYFRNESEWDVVVFLAHEVCTECGSRIHPYQCDRNWYIWKARKNLPHNNRMAYCSLHVHMAKAVSSWSYRETYRELEEQRGAHITLQWLHCRCCKKRCRLGNNGYQHSWPKPGFQRVDSQCIPNHFILLFSYDTSEFTVRESESNYSLEGNGGHTPYSNIKPTPGFLCFK